MGLFSSTAWKKQLPMVPQCGQCKLDKECPHPPKQAAQGHGARGILLIGEHPDRYAGERGSPNDTIRVQMSLAGIDMHRDCLLTWATICSPAEGPPSEAQIEFCRPSLQAILDEFDPNIIIPFGEHATRALIGPIWDDGQGYSPFRWAGFRIPCQKPNSWVCPTFHPAIARESMMTGLALAKHVKRAIEIPGKPWNRNTLPDYDKEVRVVMDQTEACRLIQSFLDGDPKNPIAVDIETDGLKPDRADALIYTCALSNGMRRDGGLTIAYPWTPMTMAATANVIFSGRPLVASNMKYEERWFIRFFGRGADYWHRDTMLRAHWEDCRQAITGLKFQSFVKLGQPAYNESVKNFLEADGGANAKNRIRSAPLRDVLHYNGMDAILERMLV